MHEAQPSRTALRVALRRAAHQIHDAPPLVFEDPLAVRILGPEHREEVKRTPNSLKRPFSAALRAFMVARARLSEDTLAHSIAANGTQQYLVLGAGLDTFAYRNPFAQVRVFEVDHPATQAWKRERLAAAGIAIPEAMRFVPVDFERQAVGSGAQPLSEELAAAGFDRTLPTVTAWLGVVPYLTLEAFRGTTSLLGSFAAGSNVVFDYSQPREVLPLVEQKMLDSMSERVALAGEPFQRFFTPEALVAELALAGLSVVEDLDSTALTARFFGGRDDGLRLRGSAGRMCVAKSG
ncbi:MAG TPA: class I SAM-dependent methyltransferase [Granulicella sp.]|jgi:methyltransferase (TIGR00027 family)